MEHPQTLSPKPWPKPPENPKYAKKTSSHAPVGVAQINLSFRVTNNCIIMWMKETFFGMQMRPWLRELCFQVNLANNCLHKGLGLSGWFTVQGGSIRGLGIEAKSGSKVWFRRMESEELARLGLTVVAHEHVQKSLKKLNPLASALSTPTHNSRMSQHSTFYRMPMHQSQKHPPRVVDHSFNLPSRMSRIITSNIFSSWSATSSSASKALAPAAASSAAWKPPSS